MRRWKKKLIIVDHIHRWYWLLNRLSKQYPEHNLLPPSCKKSSAQFVESFDIALRRRPPFWFIYLCSFFIFILRNPFGDYSYTAVHKEGDLWWERDRILAREFVIFDDGERGCVFEYRKTWSTDVLTEPPTARFRSWKLHQCEKQGKQFHIAPFIQLSVWKTM